MLFAFKVDVVLGIEANVLTMKFYGVARQSNVV